MLIVDILALSVMVLDFLVQCISCFMLKVYPHVSTSFFCISLCLLLCIPVSVPWSLCVSCVLTPTQAGRLNNKRVSF